MELIKNTFILLLFFASFSVKSQPIQLDVVVIDQETNIPIPSANIYFSKCSCGDITNKNGKITIQIERGSENIRLTSIGYILKEEEIQLQRDTLLKISMVKQNYVLDDIVITGQNTRNNLTRSQMGVQSLTATQLKNLPTAIGEIDVFRGLTMLSGVGSAGEASNGISVRGGSLDQNLVLLDHAPVYNSTHLFGLFSVFTPDAISEVELFKAHVPAQYGGRITSVLDIKVKNPEANSPIIKGGIGFVSSRIGIETPLIKDKLHLLASTRVAPNQFAFSLIEKLKNTKANFIDGTLKLKWKPNKQDNIVLTTFYSHDFYELDINSQINNITATSNQYNYNTLNMTLKWLHSFNNGSYLQSTLTSSNYDPKIFFPQENSANVIQYRSQIQGLSLTNTYSRNLNTKLNANTGIQLTSQNILPGELNVGATDELTDIKLPSELNYELSAFTDWLWAPIERLSITAGLRMTYFLLMGPYEEALYVDPERNEILDIISYKKGKIVNTHQGLEPRLGIRYSLGNNTSIKVSFARTKQYLQNIYNSTTPLPTSRWKSADAYILPQVGNTYSIGIYQNLNQDKFAISIEAYYRKVEAVIDYKPGADFFLEKFIERDIIQGNGKNYGIELNVEKPVGKMKGWLNYTWSRSLRQFKSTAVESTINNGDWYASDFDRPHVINSSISVDASKSNTIGLNFTFQSGRPYTVANAYFNVGDVPVPIFLKRNNARLPNYHRLDFSWTIHDISSNDKKRWKGDWIFTIYNIYGRKNAINKYYGSTANGNLNHIFGGFPVGGYQLSIFSTPVVSLGYNFSWR